MDSNNHQENETLIEIESGTSGSSSVQAFTSYNDLKEYAFKNNIIASCAKPLEVCEDDQNSKNHEYLRKLRRPLNARRTSDTIKNSDFQESLEEKSTYSYLWQPKIDMKHAKDETECSSSESINSIEPSRVVTSIKSLCGKAYCNYGCICDALINSDLVSRDHCGHYKCIFGCICKKRPHSDSSKNIDSDTSSNDGLRRSKRQRYLNTKSRSLMETYEARKTSYARNSESNLVFIKLLKYNSLHF
jgi:hypothetical protein